MKINVIKMDSLLIWEKWKLSGIPNMYKKEKHLYVECDENGFINFSKANVYTADELIIKNNVKLLLNKL